MCYYLYQSIDALNYTLIKMEKYAQKSQGNWNPTKENF